MYDYDVVVINDLDEPIHVNNKERVSGWFVDMLAEEGQYVKDILKIDSSELSAEEENHEGILDSLIYNEVVGGVEYSGNVVYVLDGDKAIATATVHTDSTTSRWHVAGVYVDKDYRGQGVALKLMNKIIKWAKEDKVAALSLTVFAVNKPALELYKKLGFVTLYNKMGLKCDSKSIIYKEPNLKSPYLSSYEIVPINDNTEPVYTSNKKIIIKWLSLLNANDANTIKKTLKIRPADYFGKGDLAPADPNNLIYDVTLDNGEKQNGNVLMVMDGDVLVGMVYVSYTSDSKSWYIGHAYIEKEYRGKGVCVMVLSRLNQWAMEEGILGLFTTVPMDNVPANKQANKAGFAPYLLTMGLKL